MQHPLSLSPLVLSFPFEMGASAELMLTSYINKPHNNGVATSLGSTKTKLLEAIKNSGNKIVPGNHFQNWYKEFIPAVCNNNSVTASTPPPLQPECAFVNTLFAY